MNCSAVQDGPKTGPFLKVYNPVYDDVGRRFIHQNVQLSVTRKTGILNVAILNWKHQLFKHKVQLFYNSLKIHNYKKHQRVKRNLPYLLSNVNIASPF